MWTSTGSELGIFYYKTTTLNGNCAEGKLFIVKDRKADRRGRMGIRGRDQLHLEAFSYLPRPLLFVIKVHKARATAGSSSSSTTTFTSSCATRDF